MAERVREAIRRLLISEPLLTVRYTTAITTDSFHRGELHGQQILYLHPDHRDAVAEIRRDR